MRLFLGIAIPDLQRNGLAGLQNRLPPGRAVPWDNFHLTLTFLGDASDRMVDELDLALNGMRLVSPEIRFSGLGQFGGANPRAVWAAVRPQPELENLQRRLSNAARNVGFDVPNRRFIPHVTLTRFASDTVDSSAVARFIEGIGRFELPSFQPYALTLWRSHLRSDGPRYEALLDYPVRPDQTT
ncbi:MAG: RNA 2',3'-cyclic phosphodiesterase [Boseongicola sp.]|nr:RNA 2',3'-cyclic phosphodiesterase [Boseongicola sp.]NNL18229.1 RNA 2',3'-cyclic phosphodiesterase [Boseongicola sp.]